MGGGGGEIGGQDDQHPASGEPCYVSHKYSNGLPVSSEGEARLYGSWQLFVCGHGVNIPTAFPQIYDCPECRKLVCLIMITVKLFSRSL